MTRKQDHQAINPAPLQPLALQSAAAGSSDQPEPHHQPSLVSFLPNWLFGLILVAATLIAYLPALRGGFLWDDDSWTTKIPNLLRDFSGLQTLWCDPAALQQYYPLTGTTFWVDYQCWGFWTLPYHLENVLLHAFAALLFWRLLHRLQVPGARLAGAIFALHPLMVESAGWITERKNVLSLVLYLGALLAYGRFAGFWKADKGTAPPALNPPPRLWGAYGLALLLFVAADLSKATAFSLPAVLLLVCWWKRGRLRWRADVVPSLPFFALAIGFGLVTAWLEKYRVGAQGPEWAISMPARCLIAGRALWFYAGKLLWPADLCFIYPRWEPDAASLRQWLYPVTAVGTLLALWLARARLGRGPATAAFFFAGTLFPVLGFMNAYFMRFSFVCDHWAYLSSLGLIALGAALAVQAAKRLRTPMVLYGLSGVALAVLGVLTWHQSKMYTDIETLWRTTLAKNPSAAIAHGNLGLVLNGKGQEKEAFAHFQRGLELGPGVESAHNNLGLALERAGQLDEALAHFYRAVELSPDFAEGHNNLGLLLSRKGQKDEALVHLYRAVELHPDSAETHLNLGLILREKGEVDEAILHLQRALEIKPDFVEAQYNLGNALLQKGQTTWAILCFQRLLGIQPTNAVVLNNLAWIRAANPQAEFRDGAEAVRLAEKACQLTGYREALLVGTLAAAYAEAGQFEEAVATAEKARELALVLGQEKVAEKNQELIQLYRARQPYREPAGQAEHEKP